MTGTAALPSPPLRPPSCHQLPCSSIMEELQCWKFSGLRARVGLRAPCSGLRSRRAAGRSQYPGDGTSTPSEGHGLPCPLPSPTPHFHILPSKWQTGGGGCKKVRQELSSITNGSALLPRQQFYSVLRIMQQSINTASWCPHCRVPMSVAPGMRGAQMARPYTHTLHTAAVQRLEQSGRRACQGQVDRTLALSR